MQCTILQPKGTLRTSTLPTGVDGIPTSKDIAAVLRRATEPEHAGTLATKDEQLLVEMERKHRGRLSFRADPAYHREQVIITNAQTGKEFK